MTILGYVLAAVLGIGVFFIILLIIFLINEAVKNKYRNPEACNFGIIRKKSK